MKATGSLFLGLLSMMGCSIGKPPADEVAAIEAATAKDACVGPLGRWHRVFSYQARGERVDRNIISVSYIEAGHRGRPAGRVITEPNWKMVMDDAQFRYALGEYDRKAHRFVEWSCGCNFQSEDVEGQIECPPHGA
ncbi:hypothetical protein [Sphingomonas colocasiae]|uniref:Uncharacterized protein n=1 Tax=Sphingomonas colocasiae TaxID=1848973 RepID=A0ABS7PUD8_9SPHN|nr:hypothetical protein [Sphingomonas colocasiae]MBY8824962.1 hypothetical protein [Sphingomonas colocasiae]